ncbi:Secreted protein [Williamsia muralis]|uniref:hypothetical protein n=1 Tax=Williamsia marianensis TaxID=85044 RepID=UPI0039E7BF00
MTSIRSKIAASAMTIAAAATIAVGAGAGTANADDPNWPNYKVGPSPSMQACQTAMTPYIRVSGCFHDFWPVQAYYFWGETI